MDQAARALLGARLVSTLGGVPTVGVIVETEAYGGADDPASHAATRAGRTRRNASMFAPAGTAYVYRSYGVHWCLNVVTGLQDDAQAILVRGVDALEGTQFMKRRRGGRMPLAAGPGRVCQAFGVDGSLDGHDLCSPPLQIEAGWRVAPDDIRVTGRVGVSVAADWPLRFYVARADGVTPRPSKTEDR